MKLSIILWVLKKYKNLILIITVLSLVAGLTISTLTIPTFYRATTVLMVASTENTLETDLEGTTVNQVDYMTILANKQALKTYCQIVSSTAVLEEVVKKIDFAVTPDELRGSLSVRQIGDTELMEIQVTHINPEHSVIIANTVGSVFVNYVNTILGFHNIKMIVPAAHKGFPVIPNRIVHSLIAMLAGFTLTFLSCLTADFIRQPVREKYDLENPALPYLGQIKKIKQKKNQPPVKNLTKNSDARSLFSYLTMLCSEKTAGNKICLVTSAEQAEGKSLFAAGLGLWQAQTGHKTVIIDTNLFAPIQDKIFPIPSTPGLGNLKENISGNSGLLLETGYPGLRIVPAESISINYPSLFYSTDFNTFLQSLSENVDLVIIDSPSLLDHPEILPLVKIADNVLMVVKADTPLTAVVEAIQQLTNIQAKILGVVFNNCLNPHGFLKRVMTFCRNLVVGCRRTVNSRITKG